MGSPHNNNPEVTGKQALRASALALRGWVIDEALPFWAQTARDERGGFCEELRRNKVPNWNAVRRLRVQARQIYTYSRAHELGWFDGLPVADTTLDFMLGQGFMPDEKQGFIHLLGPDMKIKDARRDTYDHAFYLLALAWHGRVSGQKSSFALADSVLAFMDSALGTNNGGYYEGHPLGDPRNALRRQNPHMHLFESFMALYDATGHEKYLKRAGEIFALFKWHFFDKDTGTITEYFHRNWSPARGPKGRTVEPGHAAEWVWLLGQYEARSGTDTRSYADRLYEILLSYPGTYLNDEHDKTGAVVRSTKRLWVQTELVKAHLSQAEFGTNGAQSMAAALLDGIADDYLKDGGVWMDALGENGLPVLGPIPASTFYHIICMIAETCRVAGVEKGLVNVQV